jgi:hypothetical protein
LTIDGAVQVRELVRKLRHSSAEPEAGDE